MIFFYLSIQNLFYRKCFFSAGVVDMVDDNQGASCSSTASCSSSSTSVLDKLFGAQCLKR